MHDSWSRAHSMKSPVGQAAQCGEESALLFEAVHVICYGTNRRGQKRVLRLCSRCQASRAEKEPETEVKENHTHTQKKREREVGRSGVCVWPKGTKEREKDRGSEIER